MRAMSTTTKIIWVSMLLGFMAGLIVGKAASAQELIISGEGTATLTWMAPTQYIDGRAIVPADLTGYVIFWNDQSRFELDGVTFRPGCAAGPVGSRNDTVCYPNVVDISDGTATTELLTFTVSTDVTLSFVIIAHTVNGLWSDYSNELDKVFTLIIDSPPGAPILESVELLIICTTNLPDVTCDFVVQ